jgi:hypothetical protein
VPRDSRRIHPCGFIDNQLNWLTVVRPFRMARLTWLRLAEVRRSK